MKIVLTGSKGLIGKVIYDYFYKTESIIGLDINSEEEDYKIDLTKEKQVKNFFKKEKFIDCLIVCHAYNPSLPTGKTLLDFSLKEFNNYMNINLTSVFSVCREFIKNNSNNSRGGNIILFSSMYGIISPNPEIYDNGEKDIAYGISKAGIIQMTKHLAVHTAPNFRVNCIAPSGIFNNQNENFIKKYTEKIPLKRMMDKYDLQELCFLIDFLTYTSYCTGSIFTVDGGYTAW